MESFDEYLERVRNDPRTTEELLEEAVAALAYKDSEDEVLRATFWNPVGILHRRADDSVMTAARRRLGSRSSADRVVAAVVLGQVHVGEPTRRDEAVEVMLPLLERETHGDVLMALAHAFGHIDDERSVPRLVELRNHPDESLRYAVVHGLLGKKDARAIAALIELSADPDYDVRNWATFGLGVQIDADTPAIREALLARLEESEPEVRGEALVGLALRGDVRVADALLRELESDEAEVLRDWSLMLDAAEAVVTDAQKTGRREWLPVLKKFRALGIGEIRKIRLAILRCHQTEAGN